MSCGVESGLAASGLGKGNLSAPKYGAGFVWIVSQNDNEDAAWWHTPVASLPTT